MSEKAQSVVKNAFDLPTYQRRLRHIRSLTLRNLQCKRFSWKDFTKLQVYFTLHTDEKQKEFYKSEIVTGSLNPSWQGFDISRFEDEIDIHAKFISGCLEGDNEILCAMEASVWVERSSLPAINLLSCQGSCEICKSYEYHLPEGKIKCLELTVISGFLLQQDKYKYQPNTLVIRMFDQFFIPPETPVNPEVDCYEAEVSAIRNSYTINSLSRIHTVLRAIKQMQASVKRVHRSIEDRLLSSQEKTRKLAEHEDLILRVSQLKNELIWQTTKQQQQKDILHSLSKCEREQSDILQERFQQLEKNRYNLNEKRKLYFQTREKYIKESAQLLIRRKQLINELTTCIYPITETSKKELCICGVRLPNSEEFQGQDDIMCSVSLGFTSHLLMMMSYLLDFPIRYQIDFRGSRSQIMDHIHSKLTDKDRTFPLYAKGKEKFQFNYGVFLLNKNISQLRLYCGLSTTDLRLTLPNIKSLLELRLGIQFDHIGMVRPLTDIKDTSSIPSIDKIETASSLASGGRYSITDSAEDALEVALRQKHGNSSDKDDIPPKVKNTVREDESEDLFKPSDDDNFFKIQSSRLLEATSAQNSKGDTVDGPIHVNGESHSHRHNFTPSPSPIADDGNHLNVNQSGLNRDYSASSLSCDFSSGEETQNSPGNPVLLSSGCDTLCQNGSFLGSNSVDYDGTAETSDKTDAAETKDIKDR